MTLDKNCKQTNCEIKRIVGKMTVYHDEIEIEDFEYDEDEDLYTYPCVSYSNSDCVNYYY